VRVKCFAQEHDAMSPARASTQTTQSGVNHTNHEATVPIVEVNEKTLEKSLLSEQAVARCSVAFVASWSC